MKRKISELGPKEGILCKTKELFLKIVALPGANSCRFLDWEWNKENHVIFPFDSTHASLHRVTTEKIYLASDFLEEDKKDKEFSHYNI